MTAQGLTWDHPRGYDALAEAARRADVGRAEPLISWDKQPLEGFESAPIADLCARYDLVVLDHPHIGEAVAEGCLRSLEDLFSAAQIAEWEAQTVGPALGSYRWAGRHWALPLDVATQVMARRADKIAEPPGDWDSVEDIAASQPVALSLGGPHAFLTLISMAAGQEHVVGGDDMLPDDVALACLARLRRLAAKAPRGTETLNPIGLLDAMGNGDGIALIPLIFGYVTYARPGHTKHALAFSDAIRWAGGKGGVLGGTGIAFSARATPAPDLVEHIAWLMRPETQTAFIPDNGGQPSARPAWQSDAVNAAWAGFYRDTLQTAEHALLRPRFDGFPTFTNAAAEDLRAALASGADEMTILKALRDRWRAARTKARGDLDDDRT
ncbi:MAG: carbohydrate ABC transporter substrate-binding protein [Pseudomonadota bacterium]